MRKKDLVAHLEAMTDELDKMGVAHPLIRPEEAEALRVGLMGGLTLALWLADGTIQPRDPEEDTWCLLDDAATIFRKVVLEDE